MQCNGRTKNISVRSCSDDFLYSAFQGPRTTKSLMLYIAFLLRILYINLKVITGLSSSDRYRLVVLIHECAYVYVPYRNKSVVVVW